MAAALAVAKRSKGQPLTEEEAALADQADQAEAERVRKFLAKAAKAEADNARKWQEKVDLARAERERNA